MLWFKLEALILSFIIWLRYVSLNWSKLSNSLWFNQRKSLHIYVRWNKQKLGVISLETSGCFWGFLPLMRKCKGKESTASDNNPCILFHKLIVIYMNSVLCFLEQYVLIQLFQIGTNIQKCTLLWKKPNFNVKNWCILLEDLKISSYHVESEIWQTWMIHFPWILFCFHHYGMNLAAILPNLFIFIEQICFHFD